MKKLHVVLLLCSAAANAAMWLGYIRPATPKQTSLAPSAVRAAPRSKSNEALAAALASGDAAALAAVGFSQDDIRAFKLGRVSSKYFDLMRTAWPKTPSDQYWRNANFNFNKMSPEQRAAQTQAQRELMDGLRSVYGDDMPFPGNQNMAYLSADKRDKIDKIQRDYDDMRQQITGGNNGVLLASDKEKLKLLDQEKERDITAAMTPAEREQYELQSSSTAQTIRNRYGEAIQSEDVYKKVFALQKAFDDQNSAGGTPQQPNAQAGLQNEIKAAIGNDAYASYQRSNDPEFKALSTLETRLSLPADTADQIYSSRNTYATQSQQIAANADLSPDQRKEQLAAVAAQAKADLVSKLGQEGADAYAAQANWITMLNNGNAFSTNPDDAPGGPFNGNGSTVSRYRPPTK